MRQYLASNMPDKNGVLTISGKDAAELSFRLYNSETNEEYYDAKESLDFVANAIVGEADNLYVVHFRGTTDLDEFASRVKVYPNPVLQVSALASA